MPITVNMHLRETAQVETVEYVAFRTIRFINADMESVDVFVRRDQYGSVAAKLRKAADDLEAPVRKIAENEPLDSVEIDTTPSPDTTAIAMLDRRYDEIEGGKVELIPGEEAFARLRANIETRDTAKSAGL